MRPMTQKFLADAFAGESQAHMKYLAFSAIAEKEGFANIARLFKAIALAEQVHATNHAKHLGFLGSTIENLSAAQGGEDFEIGEMYPVYKNTAELQGEKGATLSTHYALEAEKIHSKMYATAKKSAEKGKDIKLGDIHICPVCGYTGEGALPAKCPVCNCKKEKFVIFK